MHVLMFSDCDVSKTPRHTLSELYYRLISKGLVCLSTVARLAVVLLFCFSHKLCRALTRNSLNQNKQLLVTRTICNAFLLWFQAGIAVLVSKRK